MISFHNRINGYSSAFSVVKQLCESILSPKEEAFSYSESFAIICRDRSGDGKRGCSLGRDRRGAGARERDRTTPNRRFPASHPWRNPTQARPSKDGISRGIVPRSHWDRARSRALLARIFSFSFPKANDTLSAGPTTDVGSLCRPTASSSPVFFRYSPMTFTITRLSRCPSNSA